MQMELNHLSGALTRWAAIHAPRLVITLIVAVIAASVVRFLVKRSFQAAANSDNGEQRKRAATLQNTALSLATSVVWVVATMSILSELGIDVGPVIAAAGIVGVALGFGAQKLVQDLISGFFMLVDDQIRVGDVVQLGDHAGLVEKVGLRTIVLRDLGGNVHYVRNGEVRAVVNMTKDFSYYVFDVGVAYRENTDEVVEALKKVDEDLRADESYTGDIIEPLEVLGVDQFADSAVVIKARIKTHPLSQWKIGREFNRRMKIAFDAAGIEIPFPHMTVYVGQGKDGTSPALPLQMADVRELIGKAS